MDSVKNWLLGFDMFGVPVAFNFNRKGQTVNTFLGATFSIALRVFMLGFLVNRGVDLFLRRRNSVLTELEAADFDEIGEITISDPDTGMFLFWFVQNLGPHVFDFEESKKYLRFEIAQYDTNWYRPADEVFKVSYSDVRMCTKDDFLKHGIVEKWDQFSIVGLTRNMICPDFRDMTLKANRFAMEAMTIGINIKPCKDNCETNMTKVDDYYKKWSFVQFYSQQNANMKKYNSKPVFRSLKVDAGASLNRNYTMGGSIRLSVNKLQTQDDYVFQLGDPREWTSFLTLEDTTLS